MFPNEWFQFVQIAAQILEPAPQVPASAVPKKKAPMSFCWPHERRRPYELLSGSCLLHFVYSCDMVEILFTAAILFTLFFAEIVVKEREV